jgi:hypothetical protein
MSRQRASASCRGAQRAAPLRAPLRSRSAAAAPRAAPAAPLLLLLPLLAAPQLGAALKVMVHPDATDCLTQYVAQEHFEAQGAPRIEGAFFVSCRHEHIPASATARVRPGTAAPMCGRTMCQACMQPPSLLCTCCARQCAPARHACMQPPSLLCTCSRARSRAHCIQTTPLLRQLYSPSGELMWTQTHVDTEAHFNIAARGAGTYKIWWAGVLAARVPCVVVGTRARGAGTCEPDTHARAGVFDFQTQTRTNTRPNQF